MSEIVFRGRAVLGGWMALNGAPIGSVMDKESALDLAEDTAAAVHQTVGTGPRGNRGKAIG